MYGQGQQSYVCTDPLSRELAPKPMNVFKNQLETMELILKKIKKGEVHGGENRGSTSST